MSSNFYPRRGDEGLLSTRQDSVIGAEESYVDHVSQGWKSCGTWSFSEGDTELDVVDDQHETDTPKGHASVDFSPLSRGRREKEGKRLKTLAVRTYAAPDDSGV